VAARPIGGALAFLLLSVGLLSWAKWSPYWQRGFAVAHGQSLGHSILTGTRSEPPPVSLAAATHFALSYFEAIWPALVAGLAIAAATETLLPRPWIAHRLAGTRGALAASLLATPSMLCTCCAAPIAVSLRRRGAAAAVALAYWVGNPALNPAVLVFMAFLLPWQWVALRGVSAALLVAALVALAPRLVRRDDETKLAVQAAEQDRLADAPARYAAALARLALVLVPEYLLVVLLVGGLRGALFPISHGRGWGAAAIVAFALAGTLFVVPTGGEIPIIQGLLAAGVGAGPAGALLLTLPALSLPSLVMVRRSFPARVLVAVTGGVAALGVSRVGSPRTRSTSRCSASMSQTGRRRATRRRMISRDRKADR
jgi:uncharacterized membrane protein YraQ (UPF0718 family)